MGKPGIDYHAETKGEVNDRKKGNSLQANLLKMERERERVASIRQFGSFVFCSGGGNGMSLIAMFTTCWYGYIEETRLEAVNGNPVTRIQEWNMGLTGVGVVVSYCDFYDKTNCVIDVDQWRFFNDADNDPAIQWREPWLAPATSAGTAGTQVNVSMLIVTAVLSLAVISLLMALNGKAPRWLSICQMVTCIAAGVFNVWSCMMFMVNTEPFRAALEKENFVSGVSGPVMVQAWSYWMALAGAVMAQVSTINMGFILRAATKGADEMEEKMRIRDARIDRYLQDIQNTSFMHEQGPKDSQGFVEAGGQKQRYPGWTTEVETIPVNTFAIDPSKDIGGHRIRYVPQIVQKRCCVPFCCIKYKKTEMVLAGPQVIQSDATKTAQSNARLLRHEQVPQSPPQSPQSTEVEIEEITHEPPTNSPILSIRPMSPKGPMGGTFSPGFAPPLADDTRLTVSPLSGTAIGGFRPGSGRPPQSAMVTTMKSTTAQRLTGGGLENNAPPGSPESSIQFSATGQPMADRKRIVTRCPAPERKMRGKAQLQIGAAAK